jgi:hypothetical protein
MDHLQTRLDALEQQMHTVTRRLRWWRGLAGGLTVLAVLTWALPTVIAQEEDAKKGQKGLAQRVAALEQLLKHFSREKNEIFITGANLHLVNGLGQTACGPAEEPIPDCPNGLGNLIVGYNESRNNPQDPDVRTGSHNVVVGEAHNFSRFGGLVIGSNNEISGDFAAVSGGQRNTASGLIASVSGGFGNTASGELAVVSGGQNNTASGFNAMVSGGLVNFASGGFAVVIGGNTNDASGELAVVSGGQLNRASGVFAVVSGGGSIAPVEGEPGNTASGTLAVVSGGSGNTASGRFAVVSGGRNITQEADFGWSAGSEAEEVVVGNFRSP